MKKRYLYIASIMASFFIILITVQNGMTFSSQAPPENTGSPGDGKSNTCAKGGCHVGTVNSGPGSITIDASSIPASGWIQGKTYQLRVIVAENNITNFGFQVTVEDPLTQNKAGVLSTGGNSKVVVSFKDWLSHKDVSPGGDWKFDWTAPTNSTLEVIIYATGNAANGNGTNSGDHIYQTDLKVKRDLNPTGISTNDGLSAVKVLQNPVSDVLRINSIEGIEFSLYALSGERVKSFYSSKDMTEIDVSGLNSGMYILSNMEGNVSKRIIIR